MCKKCAFSYVVIKISHSAAVKEVEKETGKIKYKKHWSEEKAVQNLSMLRLWSKLIIRDNDQQCLQNQKLKVHK